MRNYCLLLLAFVLTGCCSTPYDVSLDNAALKKAQNKGIQREARTVKAKYYPEHHVACRADYQDPYEKDIVDEILNGIKSKMMQTGDQPLEVVLYFHGGLSHQEYMVGNLGRGLMQEVFKKEEVSDTIYPVFMNYDAGPLDWDFDSIKTKGADLVNSEKFIKFETIFENKVMSDTENLDPGAREEIMSLNAANVIYQAIQGQNKSITSRKEITDKDIEDFYSILEAKSLPKKFDQYKEYDPEVEELSYLLQGIYSDYQGELNSDEKSRSPKSVLDKTQLPLRVLRIFSRLALETDHGLGATIREEVYDHVQFPIIGWLGKAGELHWDKVKRHSKQCFTPNSNGRTIVDALRKLRAENPGKLRINTLSHSAGSIPTAELLVYLNQDSTAAKTLNDVVMLAPAINQQAFTGLVIPNSRVVDKLWVFALSKLDERADSVGNPLLYPASLLYAVSSLAEQEISMDKMLLLDQHMNASPGPSWPYTSKVYQCLAGEKPFPVWNTFKENSQMDFTIYRQVSSSYSVKQNSNERPAHENTKYPWATTPLAHRYLDIFGVKDADKLEFKKPKYCTKQAWEKGYEKECTKN